MNKDKNEVWKIIGENTQALTENFNDNANIELLRVLKIEKECKHIKGTETQTDYDILNGYTVIRVYCVSCHKLLLMQIYNTHKGFSVLPKTDKNKMESVYKT
jgi:predicted nucleic acid-binding Zn finger protein